MKHGKKILFFMALLCLILYPLSKHRLHSLLFQHDIDNSFSFSEENGFYTKDLQISMTLSNPLFSRMHIYYTLDGSTPDSSSTLYTQPLTFASAEDIRSVNLRAVVCDRDGYTIGGPYNACYFVGKNVDLWTNALVVSLTTEEDGLYSPETGILYPMATIGSTEEEWSWFKRQNCKQRGDDWIRNAHMEIFEPDGRNVMSQDVGLCVDGDHGSMTHYPYSLKVLAGSEYDSAHPSFNYDIFHYYNTRGTEFCHIQNFNNIVFRNGGNEYNAGIADPEQKGTMLRWNVGSRLADEAGFMVAGARPAIIYLNGELYGVMQLQDTYNRHNTESKTHLSRDFLEIYKDAERVCTQYGGYEDLYYSYPDIENSRILSEDVQQSFEETVSMTDMFSYYAYELLVNNTDFPKKNYAIWRYLGSPAASYPLSDGKYRFLINDLDCTYDFRYDDDLWVAYFSNIKENGTVMGTLTQIDHYRDQFLNTLCDLMNSGLFDREHLDLVINKANNDFNLIAGMYYTPEDEAQRQRNVGLLKEAAFARKDELYAYIDETFSPKAPYELQVSCPDSGTLIRFSTTELTCKDGDFSGRYYGDYPMTLSCEANAYHEFAYWEINGEKVYEQEITLDSSLIRDGKITVQLITEQDSSCNGLMISEACCEKGNTWVEIYNPTDHPINLREYALTNSSPSFLRFRLPDQDLAPGEIFVAGIEENGTVRLKADASVSLIRKGKMIDSITIPYMAERESYGRFGETDAFRYYANPTPGAVN